MVFLWILFVVLSVVFVLMFSEPLWVVFTPLCHAVREALVTDGVAIFLSGVVYVFPYPEIIN